jgi:hypothetical protein
MCITQKKEGRCVEQIELRHDGSVSAREEDLRRGFSAGMWCPREKWLRRQGIVAWRTINLHTGDAEGKMEVVDEWDSLQERSKAYGEGKSWVLPPATKLEHRQRIADLKSTRAELIRDLETAEANKSRLARAAARVAEWDLEDEFLGIKKQASSLIKDDAAAAAAAATHLQATRTDIERMFDHLPQLELDIARQKEYWDLRICAQFTHLHDSQLQQHDFHAAVATAEAWRDDQDHVLLQVYELLQLVLRGRMDGLSDPELSAAVQAAVSPVTRKWVARLVPRFWGELGVQAGGG